MKIHLDPGRRHDALLVFDVTDGNPNGDPDAQNRPRTDEETGHGLVTDVAIKRKIRDTVGTIHCGEPGFGIFVEGGVALNARDIAAREARPDDPLAHLCELYYDVRMFGAVLTGGGRKRGNTSYAVRGPMQVGFARSVDPVLPVDHTITRVTQTRQEDIDKGESTEIASKWAVPYGLYRQQITFSTGRATNTGVTAVDLEAFWHALLVMFDLDRAANRGVMQTCGLWVFSHESRFGCAPAGQLLRMIRLRGRDDRVPRSLDDYARDAPDQGGLPAGVEVTVLADSWG